MGCVDGVAGLEGRFRKIESCSESLFVQMVVMIADGGALCGGAERVNDVVAEGESNLILTCGHIEVDYLFIAVDDMLSVW